MIRSTKADHSIYAMLLTILLAATAFGQTSTNGELKSLAGYRYLERTENARADAKGLPLVIGLHWSSSTPEEFGGYISGFQFPVRILLLEGPYEHPRGGRSFYVRQPVSYYDMNADEKMAQLLKEADRLGKFIEAATALCSPKRKPIVIGASQGGDLSYVTAIRHASLITAAYPLLATFDERILNDAAMDKKKVPIFVYHGDDDPIVNLGDVKGHVKALSSAGYKVRLSTYPNTKHDISPQMKKDFVRQITKTFE